MRDDHTTPQDRIPRELSELYPRATEGVAAAEEDRHYRPSVILSKSFQSPERVRRLKAWLIGVNVLLFLLLVTIAMPHFFATTANPYEYATQEFQGSPVFSVSFDKSAEQTVRNGKTSLKGRDLAGQHTLYVQVASLPSKVDCKSNTTEGGTTEIVSSKVIEGGLHPLCYASSVNSYQANFVSDGNWYYVAVIPESRLAAIDLRTVEHIVESVQVR